MSYPAGTMVSLVRPKSFNELLFKYGKHDHTRLLAAQGLFRVGTTFDYRRDHGWGIADPNESTKRIEAPIDHLEGVGPNVLKDAGLEGLLGDRFVNRGRISMHGAPGSIKFIRSDDGPDMYVYCFSTELSAVALSQFQDYDACAAIIDVHGFVAVMTEALCAHRPCRFMGLARSAYTGHSEQWNGVDLGIPGYFLKDRSFASQNEVRAVWQPLSNDPIEPLTLRALRLTHFCSQMF